MSRNMSGLWKSKDGKLLLHFTELPSSVLSWGTRFTFELLQGDIDEYSDHCAILLTQIMPNTQRAFYMDSSAIKRPDSKEHVLF